MKIIYALLVTMGILSSSALAQTSPPDKPLDKVEFRLDWTLTGYQLPFFWAQKKGYYKDVGLDVDIKLGAGSQQTINLVGGGHDEIGFADLSLMAASTAKGMHVKAIFAVVQQNAWSIYSHADTPILKPEDLVGKSVALVVDHKPMIDQLIKINKIDPSKVQLRTLSAATRNTIFAQHATDGILAISIGSTRGFGGEDVHQMQLGDFGVNLLGQGLIANYDFLQTRPDVARRFLAATSRAFGDLLDLKNLDEAVQIGTELSGTTTKLKEMTEDEWKNTLPRLASKSEPGKPIGFMSEADWRDTIKTLKDTGRVDADVSLDKLYTNEFIPADGPVAAK